MEVEEPKKKLVDDILKESLVNAQERAEVVVMIINNITKMSEKMDEIEKRLEEVEKGKKRKIE